MTSYRQRYQAAARRHGRSTPHSDSYAAQQESAAQQQHAERLRRIVNQNIKTGPDKGKR